MFCSQQSLHQHKPRWIQIFELKCFSCPTSTWHVYHICAVCPSLTPHQLGSAAMLFFRRLRDVANSLPTGKVLIMYRTVHSGLTPTRNEQHHSEHLATTLNKHTNSIFKLECDAPSNDSTIILLCVVKMMWRCALYSIYISIYLSDFHNEFGPDVAVAVSLQFIVYSMYMHHLYIETQTAPYSTIQRQTPTFEFWMIKYP